MKAIIAISALCTFLLSCDRPKCTNQNPTFDSFSMDSKEYKNELAKEIQRIGITNLSYWLKSYLEKDDKEYIIVNIQNKDLCAKGMIEVKDWSKIEGIRKSKGISYRGAELEGFVFEINESNGSNNFVYQTLDKIID